MGAVICTVRYVGIRNVMYIGTNGVTRYIRKC